MSFDISLRNTLRLNNVVTVRKEDREGGEEKKYANWLNLFKIPMRFFPILRLKPSLIMREKKGLCVFKRIYLESDVFIFFLVRS